jgi:hypothetical protein
MCRIPKKGTFTMSDENLKAELDRLKKENEALKKTSSKGLSLKVSEKGGLSVYGLGRFPVTLYKEQWNKLLDMTQEIRDFIKANESSLKTK